jgi:hypothetical protein
LGSFSLQPRSSNSINDGSYGPQSTGISVDAVTAFKVRVTGTIIATPNYAEVPCLTEGSAPDVGTYGPGQSSPQWNALQPYITTNLGEDIRLHLAPDGAAYESDDRPADRAVTVIANLSGIVGAVGCEDGTGGGSYALSGGYQVQVINLSAVSNPQIQLTVDKRIVRSGDIVVASTTVTGATQYTLTGYSYSGTAQQSTGQVNGLPPCLGTSPVPAQCYIKVGSAGTLTVTAQADGQSLSDNKAIAILGCEIFGDTITPKPPFLLDPVVQQQILDLISQTGWNKGFGSQVEQGGYFVNSNGTQQWVPYDGAQAGITPGPCLSAMRTSTFSSLTGITMVIHTHPYLTAPVANPGNCYNYVPGVGLVPRTGSTIDPVWGPSGADIAPWANPMNPQFPAAYPGVLVDGLNIYTWQLVNGQFTQQRWITSGCARAAGGL